MKNIINMEVFMDKYQTKYPVILVDGMVLKNFKLY